GDRRSVRSRSALLVLWRRSAARHRTGSGQDAGRRGQLSRAAFSATRFDHSREGRPVTHAPLPLLPAQRGFGETTRRDAWWPSPIVFSPALLILPFPGLFRFTCYYYRGAYYKAFWADPPNCAVGEPRKTYLGENGLPLVLQNLHRYALYIALAFIVILSYDV